MHALVCKRFLFRRLRSGYLAIFQCCGQQLKEAKGFLQLLCGMDRSWGEFCWCPAMHESDLDAGGAVLTHARTRSVEYPMDLAHRICKGTWRRIGVGFSEILWSRVLQNQDSLKTSRFLLSKVQGIFFPSFVHGFVATRFAQPS